MFFASRNFMTFIQKAEIQEVRLFIADNFCYNHGYLGYIPRFLEVRSLDLEIVHKVINKKQTNRRQPTANY